MANHRNFHTDSNKDVSPTQLPRQGATEFSRDFYSLVENAPDIIFVVNLQGDFLFINKTAQAITGYPLKDLHQKDLLSIVAPEHHVRIEKIFQNLRQLNHLPLQEVEIISLNGNKIPIDIHMKPIKEEEGRIVAILGIARDITERKKVEETLRESEKKYATLVEKARDGVVIIQDGICKFTNYAVEKITGYSREELVGKPLFDKIIAEDKEQVVERYKLRLENKDVPSVYNVRILCKNGAVKDVEISAALIPYDSRPAVLSILRDLTERKRWGEALHKSEEKYRLLVENIDDVIFILDKKGHFNYISPAIHNYNGLTSNELKGKSLVDLVHPDDKELISEAMKSILKGEKKPHEFRLVHHEGKECYLRVSCRPLTEGNLKAGILGIATNITERKKVIEELNQAYKEVEDTKTKLKAIIDKAPNLAIQGFNKEGEILFWNPTSEKLFGFSENEVKGKTLEYIFASEEQAQEFQAQLDEVFQQKKPSIEMESAITTKAEEKRCVLSSIFPIFLPEQEPIAIALYLDITTRKNVEEKMRDVNRQIERFSEISADILAIEEEEFLFDRIADAVVDISDYSRVLISYFTDDPPYRKIIGHKGISAGTLERVKKVEMPREKFTEYFSKGIKIGRQTCYIPHNMKDMLDRAAVIKSDKPYPNEDGKWHRDDNLLVSMKDTHGKFLGIISVDDSKSGLVPTKETVRPLEIFANMISEIIQRRGLVKKIKVSEEKYRELIENIKVGIFRAKPDGKLLEINPTALETFGYKRGEEFLKLRINDLFQDPDQIENFIKQIENEGMAKNQEFLLTKKDGTFFWASLTSTSVEDTEGNMIYYDTVIEDITDRKQLEDKVKRLSVTDELTGLYNRRYFNEAMPGEIKTAEKWRSTLSIIMLDVDDFKSYNDTYQHLKGDEVLIEAALVINQNIRKETDWAARFGGDEYAVVLPGADINEATAVAERIRQSFQNIKFRPEGKAIQKTLSIGVAYCFYKDYVFKHQPSAGPKQEYARVATKLTRLADQALYEAKESGKNKVVVAKESIEISRMQTPH